MTSTRQKFGLDFLDGTELQGAINGVWQYTFLVNNNLDDVLV